jgi:hypothetical protein
MNPTAPHHVLASCAALLATVASAPAAALLSPGDPILGGQMIDGNFVVGVAGTTQPANNWPAAESPDHTIDGVGQKYLNFAEVNTGFLVTPTAVTGGLGSIVTSVKLWAANDAVERDPTGINIYGTNIAIAGAGPFSLADFTMVGGSALALPASRNAGGGAALDDINSQEVALGNGTPYTSYLVIFPDVKDPAAANSMQIAEVQIFGDVVPEPGVFALIAMGLLLGLRRRR